MSAEGTPKADGTPGPGPTGGAPGPDPTDWESRFKYLLADFDNFRRRTERERAGIRNEAEAALLRRFIPLVEGFQRAEEAGRTFSPSDPMRRGLELLGKELDTVFRSVSFEPVAQIGEPFRPEDHEAIGETPVSPEAGDGAVSEVVQQGYRFQGGLLRPAKVLVARAAKPTEPATEPAPAAPASGSDGSP